MTHVMHQAALPIRTQPFQVLLLWLALLLPALAPAAPLALLTNQESDDVTVIDTATHAVIATIAVGDQPAGISVATTRPRAWVSNPGDKTISIIDTDALTQIGNTAVGDGPLALLIDEPRGQLYVADWFGNRVLRLDPDTLETLGQWPTGQVPAGLALAPDGATLYVSNRDDHSVSAIDIDSGVTRTVGVGRRPFGITLDRRGARLYTANVYDNTVTAIDTARFDVIASIPVGDRPYDVAAAAGDTRLFVTNQYDNTVSVIDTQALSVIDTLEVGEYPEGIDTHPDDTRVYVANWFDNTATIIDSATLEIVDTIDTGNGTRAYGNLFTATALPAGTAGDAVSANTPEPALDRGDVLVLDFELNDLTLNPETAKETERVRTLQPLLRQRLHEIHGHTTLETTDALRAAAARGQGYLFDRPPLAAQLGAEAGARWVVSGRLHKASFLFVYLKAQLIDTRDAGVKADFVVEVKGWSPKLTGKGIETLAVQIDAAIRQLTTP